MNLVSAGLLQAVYRALDDDVDWSQILGELVSGLDASGGYMGIVEVADDGHPELETLATTGPQHQRRSKLDRFSLDEEVLSRGQLPTVLETHRDGADGLHEIRAGGWLRHRAVVLLDLQRRKPLREEDCQQVRQLMEHLARVVRTRRELHRARNMRRESAAALNALRVPAAIVDTQCTVLANNDLFDRVLERGTLRVGADRCIQAPRKDLTERLLENVRGVASGEAEARASDENGDVRVVLDARPHYRTTVVASPVVCADGATRRVLLSVYHPDADHRIDDQLLEQLYEFTPTEAQTAARLAEGFTIEEIADLRRCARSTVRTHVKRVLRKTGTHRQAELVRLILGSPAAKLTAWGA